MVGQDTKLQTPAARSDLRKWQLALTCDFLCKACRRPVNSPAHARNDQALSDAGSRARV